MSDHEHTEPAPDEREETREDRVQTQQQEKGYGQDEGEREDAIEQEITES
jgi:hypothetical protein